MWIYKHNLFHRDRPQDLYRVRRRTCPGVDGRKQRFSRLSAQRLNSPINSNNDGRNGSPAEGGANTAEPTVSDDDGSSNQQTEAVDDEVSPVSTTKIIKMDTSSDDDDDGDDEAANVNGSGVRDTSTEVVPSPTPTTTTRANAFIYGGEPNDDQDESEDESSSSITTNDIKNNKNKMRRMEMMQQSLIVSEVAVKLEEYVKKAMKEKGITSRTRRGASGIVTPPFGSSSDLITYDDEYHYEDYDNHSKYNGGTSLKVVSDSEDSRSSRQGRKVAATKDDKAMRTEPPVTEAECIKRITQGIIQQSSMAGGNNNEDVIYACANVAAFFMCTSPNEGPEECCEKVLHLLGTSPRLQADFYFYRAALQPCMVASMNGEEGPTNGEQHVFTDHHALALRQSLLGGAAGRLASLRDFKIFAVNLIHMLLGVNGSLGIEGSISPEDRAILLHTTEVWSKSIGDGA